MLQQVMTNPGEIIFREVPVPEVKENQVLVKIMNIGVCGSDIHVYHGKHPFTKYPVTQGHEVSGEITELGKNVTEFHVGQKVTIEPQVYCGHCYPCRHGKYNLCEELKVMGFQTTGTASEYFAVDASKVTPIPEDMSYEEGAMIEPLAVAVHGVKQMGDAGFGSDSFHAFRGFVKQRSTAEKGEFACGADMGHMESRTGFPCQFDGQFRRTETSFFVADGRVVFHVRVVSIPFPERFQVGRYDGRVFAMGHDEQGGAAEYGA